MPEVSAREDRGRALLAGALVCVVLALTVTALAAQSRFDGIDQLTRSLVHQVERPGLRSSMEAASLLGGTPGQIMGVVLAFGILWGRRRRWALALPGVMAGAGLLQLGLKWALDRPRPNLDPWGFPSAHVLSLVVLFGYLAYVVGASTTRGLGRRLAVGTSATIVCTVAYSRLYLDAHWLSDVLGGLSVGLAYVLAAIWLIRFLPAFFESPPWPIPVRAGSEIGTLPSVATTATPIAGAGGLGDGEIVIDGVTPIPA